MYIHIYKTRVIHPFTHFLHTVQIIICSIFNISLYSLDNYLLFCFLVQDCIIIGISASAS
ncbi:hypothetical protein BDV28DRAFT_143248 [Aspergillus coremiiformis]|uniref:Uncharacterized protein n=1 Tax=Aspergillus coremiiformis TaxID=138285 RepID=A0A5N6YTW4_9EURO|nr:hypothetical protein BDV28DRAFT_143248 [Aspergillus coremiiformis]